MAEYVLISIDNNHDGIVESDDYPKIIDRLGTLFEHCRSTGIPIIHITGLSRMTSCVPMWFEALRSNVPTPEEDEQRYQIIADLAPRDGEAVIQKAAPSAFFGTPLVPLVNSLGAPRLLFCGQSTSGCVRASVVDSASYRYRTTVFTDGVYDKNSEAHRVSLQDMASKYAELTDIDSFIKTT